MHVHFGHQQRGQQLRQLISDFVQLHDHHLADAKRDVVLVEQLLDELRVAGDQPGDR